MLSLSFKRNVMNKNVQCELQEVNVRFIEIPPTRQWQGNDFFIVILCSRFFSLSNKTELSINSYQDCLKESASVILV